MATLREWFDEFTAATGEKVETVVLGDGGYDVQWEDTAPGLVVAYDELPTTVLDREFDDDFGLPCSPNLCAWSPSWVLLSDNYDGAEDLLWVPRHPVAHRPVRAGGG
jgi:hypothetical protein